jgi:uncharacterized membrane protein YbhN (UPF0104 family)
LGLVALALGAAGALLLFPALSGIPGRLSHTCGGWLTLAAGLELLSAAGYVMIFALTFCAGMAWRGAVRVACGSLAAGTVLPGGGVAGPVLAVSCARAERSPAASLPVRVIAFFLLTNIPNLVLLAGLGVALWAGAVPGPSSPELTIVPALVALGLLGAIYAMSAWTGPPRRIERHGLLRVLTAGIGTLTAGAREAVTLIKARNWKLSGAVASYGFDNLALWATLRALGHSPALSVIVMAFLIGGLGNALPLPGGLGGTELGLVGGMVLYGVAAAPVAAAVVLAYRVVSTGVPLMLGGVALHGLHLSMPGFADGSGLNKLTGRCRLPTRGRRRRRPA